MNFKILFFFEMRKMKNYDPYNLKFSRKKLNQNLLKKHVSNEM